MGLAPGLGGSAALGQFMGSALCPTLERVGAQSLVAWPRCLGERWKPRAAAMSPGTEAGPGQDKQRQAGDVVVRSACGYLCLRCVRSPRRGHASSPHLEATKIK